MKWFNCDEYFVVVVEKGDYYGADSAYLHQNKDPDIRIFGRADFNEGKAYPLALHVTYNTFKHSALQGTDLELVNGTTMANQTTKKIYEYIESLLVNSGSLKRAA